MSIDTKEDNTAVIVVDLQGDFTEYRQGSLAVKDTDGTYLEVVETETRRLKSLGFPVFATQDWHPEDHISFFTNHKDAGVFDSVKIKDRTQILWPPHCVQGTSNAALLLDNTLFDAVIPKGSHPEYDSYSGFFDDGGQPTGLEKVLGDQKIKKLIIYGLTTDYCARATVLDALSLGFEVVLILDLCRGVAKETTRAAIKEMTAAGCLVI